MQAREIAERSRGMGVETFFEKEGNDGVRGAPAIGFCSSAISVDFFDMCPARR